MYRKISKERDEAFTDFVLTGSRKRVNEYMRKYMGGVPTDLSEQVIAAGIYKAVQECTNIPEHVKELAAQKCIELGFKPTMRR